jgi:hypothetical protein
MRNPGQFGGCTRESEVESVDIVHTSFLLDRKPKNEDMTRPSATHSVRQEIGAAATPDCLLVGTLYNRSNKANPTALCPP